MIIKSFIAYRLRERVAFEALEDNLKPFAPCTSQQSKSTGWVPPISGDIKLQMALDREHLGRILIRQHTEEKVLPAPSIRKLIKDEARKLDRKPTKSDLNEIRDRVIAGLLPNALIKESDVFGIIDNVNRLLIVGTSSETKAADFLYLLRSQLATLQVHRLRTNVHPGQRMAQWCSDYREDGRFVPEDINLENKIVIRSGVDKPGVARFQGIDLADDAVQKVLTDTAEVRELELTVDDNINFVLTEDLTLKSIKFLDLLKQRVEEHFTNDDVVTSTEAQLFIEAGTYAPLVNRIVEWFGGEPADDKQEDEDEI